MTIPDLLQVRPAAPTRLDLRVSRQNHAANPFARLSLEGLLNQHPYLPEETAVLGICDDGLPVLLDFTDPMPGSVLVAGSQLTGSRQLLQLVLSSTLRRTTSHGMDVLVVSQDPAAWQSVINKPGRHHLEILPIYDRISGVAILHLSRMLEQRMNGRSRSETAFLFIDDVQSVSQLDLDVQVNLQWLIDQGPQYGIWSFAAMAANGMEKFDSFVPSFRTRILGQVDEPGLTARLANVRSLDTTKFHPSQQFCVRIKHNWMNFWLPGQ